jgi:acyl-CoA dehydrogenase
MDTLGSSCSPEELGRSTFSGAAITILVAHRHGLGAHGERGTAAQKAHWMPKIVAGTAITAVAVTEPDAGSDVKAIRTSARRDGDHYVLNGTKDVHHQRRARRRLFRRREDLARRAPLAADLDVHRREGHARLPRQPRARQARLALVGHRELVFEDCRIPAENLLGKEGRGFYAIMSNFQNERTVIGAMAMGEAQAALDLTLDYVTTRKAFGGTLYDKQGIRQRLAMLAARSRPGGSSSITRPGSTRRASTARARSRW